MDLQQMKTEFIRSLAESGAIFFKEGLKLKDGRPTPYFINLGKLTTGRLSYDLGRYFAAFLVIKGIVEEADIIIGPSYKGSAIAQATSIALYKEYGINVAFDYDRKETKSHGESTNKASFFVNNQFFDGCRLIIVDDVLTSMATKYELIEKVKITAFNHNLDISIKAVVIGIDREQTTAVYDSSGKVLQEVKGKDPIQEFVSSTGIPVYSLLKASEIIEMVSLQGIPIYINGKFMRLDQKTKELFDQYMKLYGVKNAKK